MDEVIEYGGFPSATRAVLRKCDRKRMGSERAAEDACQAKNTRSKCLVSHGVRMRMPEGNAMFFPRSTQSLFLALPNRTISGMKNLLFFLTATLVTAAGLQAQSRSGYSATADFTYTSKCIFRGIQTAGNSFQPSVEVAAGDFNAGLWTNQPIEKHENNEIDLYAGLQTSGERGAFAGSGDQLLLVSRGATQPWRDEKFL